MRSSINSGEDKDDITYNKSIMSGTTKQLEKEGSRREGRRQSQNIASPTNKESFDKNLIKKQKSSVS